MCENTRDVFGFFSVRKKRGIRLPTENSLSKSKNLLTKFYSILE